jgi:hypothetical protein
VAVGTHQPQAGIVRVTALQSVPAGRHDVNGDGDLVTVEKLRERLPVGDLTRLWSEFFEQDEVVLGIADHIEEARRDATVSRVEPEVGDAVAARRPRQGCRGS